MQEGKVWWRLEQHYKVYRRWGVMSQKHFQKHQNMKPKPLTVPLIRFTRHRNSCSQTPHEQGYNGRGQ